MLVRTTQTDGGPVIIQSEQVVYLRQITPTATGVVLGAKGFSEFAISVDSTIEHLVREMEGAARFIVGRQTGGGPVAINDRHIRYARGEGEATVFVLGARGGEEFAVSVDVDLDTAIATLSGNDNASEPEAADSGAAETQQDLESEPDMPFGLGYNPDQG